MLNDRSSILSLLQTRRSGKPRELVGPGPTPQEIEQILTIAMRVPDHGMLTPWRFVTVADAHRDGLGVVGAFHVPTIDGYEWHRGFDARLGLFDRDRGPKDALGALPTAP